MNRFSRVLLIAPRFNKGKHRISITPLAGIGYIAEALRVNGFEVTVLDMNLRYEDSDLFAKIRSFEPDLIGFTVMTFGHRDVYSLLEEIKRQFPHIQIVAGGPHVSTLQEKALEDCPAIDYGIMLEGDVSIIKLLRGERLEQINGFIYRDGGKIMKNPFTEFIENLDTVRFPRFSDFELNKYPVRQIGIVTSRGCPYNCIYCPVISAIGKKFRQRSAQSIIEEIDYWYERGYRELLFVDDNFTLIRSRVEELCKLIKSRNYKGMNFKCPNGIRADRVDKELLAVMKDVGFTMVAFGVEAADDAVLNNIKKGETIATIEKSLKAACDLGFDVDLFFLIGSPGETLEDVRKSFALALRYPVRQAFFYNIIPFPATELYDWIKERGYFLHPPEQILNNASHFINEPCFYTPEMSADTRKKAFVEGQSVSRTIRRRFIERKICSPLLIRKMISGICTEPAIEMYVLNNPALLRLKQLFKDCFVNRN